MVVQENNNGIFKTMKVLLIGNGPSVLEQNMGERIDSDEFDLVCRINRGHKQDNGELNVGFEKQVGTRCDVWFCSDLRLKLAKERTNEYNQIFVYFPSFKFNSNIQKDVNAHFENIEILDPIYEKEINSKFNFSPHWPSTGIIAIQYLQKTNEDIYIHGFDTYDVKYDTSHFFENRPNKYKNFNNSDHSPILEREYINYMIKNNKIKTLI